MNFSSLAARFARITPRKLHVGAPLLLMGFFYWLSSVPGAPLPGDPAFLAVFYWAPALVQNALHVPAFAALASVWCWALGAWLRSPRASAIAAFAIVLAYAVFDEWHQSMVPGRFASPTDLVLDITGAALGIWLGAWILSRPKSQQSAAADT